MKNVSVMLLLIIVVIFCFAGCNSRNADITVEAAGIHTIEPPEDGWTLEQLNEVLYMNGQKIELPLMFSSLKDGYEIRDKRYNGETSVDRDIVGGCLYYNDELVSLITFYELENDAEILTMFFSPAIYDDKQDYSAYININGFGLKNDISDIYDRLGNSFANESGIIIYAIKNSDYILDVPDAEDFGIYIKKKGEV